MVFYCEKKPHRHILFSFYQVEQLIYLTVYFAFLIRECHKFGSTLVLDKDYRHTKVINFELAMSGAE